MPTQTEVTKVVIGTPLSNALDALRWAADGEFGAHVSPASARALLGHIESEARRGEPAEPEREKFTLTVTDSEGNPIFSREVEQEDFDDLMPEPEITSRDYTTGTGQVLRNVHPPEACADHYCAIHHPSKHHMKDWPTNFRDGGMFDIKPPHMERMCPHGVGHPDPDDAAYHDGAVDIHGCDGCCMGGGPGVV